MSQYFFSNEIISKLVYLHVFFYRQSNEKKFKLVNQTSSWLWQSYLMCTGSYDCKMHTDQNFARYERQLEWTQVLQQSRRGFHSFCGLKLSHGPDTKLRCSFYSCVHGHRCNRRVHKFYYPHPYESISRSL